MSFINEVADGICAIELSKIIGKNRLAICQSMWQKEMEKNPKVAGLSSRKKEQVLSTMVYRKLNEEMDRKRAVEKLRMKAFFK